MPSEEVNCDAIVETLKEYERWKRMLQVNARKIKEAIGEERMALVDRRQVIKKHLAYYEKLLSEMKAVYSPVTVSGIIHG